MTEFPNALLTADQVGLAKLYDKPELIRLRIKGAGYDGDY